MMKPRERLKMDRADNYLTGYISDVEKVYTSGGDLFIPRLKISNPPPGGAEWISHHFYAILDEAGEVDKVVVLTQDLTESFRVREKLEETEGQYRELAENVPVAVFRTSTEKSGRLLSANPEMLRMFGFAQDDDLSEIRIEDLYVDPSRREVFMKSILEGKDVEEFEVELRRKDGSIFLASISARGSSGLDGSTAYIEGIVRDITAIKRAESELQSSEKLKSIGSLAGGIAHDFNNILMGIQGNVSLALARLGEHSAVAELRRVENAVREATGLAKQLLTFSVGGVPIRESMDIVEVLKETVNFMLRGSSVKAEFSIDSDLMPLFADVGQISQALGNIVLNSVQAMPDGGIVSIRIRNEILGKGDLEPLPAGNYVVISIRDTGQGIPAADMERLFNPYFSTRAGGSGLGLAICYSIVSKHGGTIKVYSEVGKGAEFRIYLPGGMPSYEESHEEGEQPPVSLSANGDARILVMDDDVLVREVLEGMLLQLGYRSETCSRGEEAVDLYRKAMEEEDPFSLVILDLTIPGGKGGVRTIRDLRQFDPEVRAVVSSGYSNDPVLSDPTRYGFIYRLAKPFTIAVLSQCMKKALASGRPRS